MDYEKATFETHCCQKQCVPLKSSFSQRVVLGGLKRNSSRLVLHCHNICQEIATVINLWSYYKLLIIYRKVVLFKRKIFSMESNQDEKTFLRINGLLWKFHVSDRHMYLEIIWMNFLISNFKCSLVIHWQTEIVE